MMRDAVRLIGGLVLAGGVAIASIAPASAQDNLWRIAKVSGEAWVSSQGVQPASAAQETQLRPGDSIRTGRNGRVLLVRGAETMLVSANSAISLPEAGRPGMSTVIQQAGSILLDVEKRNVQHFEVETPYLAAVVKGTRFRVTLEQGRAKVDVVRGQVQVADFRSGQFALVMQGQSARASFGPSTGLRLSGAGTPGRIEQGSPQAARVAPLAVPAGGLKPAPGSTPLLRGSAPGALAPVLNDASDRRRPAAVARAADGGTRIGTTLGEVKLDIHKVTRGMARSEAQGNGDAQGRATVWKTGALEPGSRGNAPRADAATGTSGGAATAAAAAGQGVGKSVASRAEAGLGTSVGTASSGAGTSASASGNGTSGGNGKSGSGNGDAGGNGKGNSGNGNAGGNGNGNSGNSNAGGNGNGNSGNSNAGGNGNSNAGGNGNGNAYGLVKKVVNTATGLNGKKN
jgi:hypothetical protein